MKMLFSNPLLLTWLIAFSLFTMYSLPKFIRKDTMEYKLIVITFIISLVSVVFLILKAFAPQVLIFPISVLKFLDAFASVAIFFFYCLIVMLPGTIAKFSDKKALQSLIINVLFFVTLIILVIM